MAVTSASALLPLAAGRRPSLTEALASLDAANPFARIAGVHVARFEVMEDRGPHGTLLFGVSCDGAVGDVVAALAEVVPGPSEAVWSCCAGYPGGGSDPAPAARAALARWVEGHLVAPSIAFRTYPGTVEEVGAALDAHERFRSFAHRAQSLSPAELRAAFRQEFPRR